MRLAELEARTEDIKEAPLRRDVRSLGMLLGQVLREQAGEPLFADVEQLNAHRAMRFSTVLIFTLLFMGRFMFASGEKQIALDHPLRSEGLRVIDFGNPAFPEELKQLLGATEREELKPLLDQAIIISNDTGRFIWGFTVIYVYPDQTTENGASWQHRVNVSPGGAVDRQHMLAPGSRYLVTPVSSIIAARTLDGTKTLQPSPQVDLAATVANFMAQDSQFGKRVLISIDSIVYEDGQFVGPDIAGQNAESILKSPPSPTSLVLLTGYVA